MEFGRVVGMMDTHAWFGDGGFPFLYVFDGLGAWHGLITWDEETKANGNQSLILGWSRSQCIIAYPDCNA